MPNRIDLIGAHSWSGPSLPSRGAHSVLTEPGLDEVCALRRVDVLIEPGPWLDLDHGVFSRHSSDDEVRLGPGPRELPEPHRVNGVIAQAAEVLQFMRHDSRLLSLGRVLRQLSEMRIEIALRGRAPGSEGI